MRLDWRYYRWGKTKRGARADRSRSLIFVCHISHRETPPESHLARVSTGQLTVQCPLLFTSVYHHEDGLRSWHDTIAQLPPTWRHFRSAVFTWHDSLRPSTRTRVRERSPLAARLTTVGFPNCTDIGTLPNSSPRQQPMTQRVQTAGPGSQVTWAAIITLI